MKNTFYVIVIIFLVYGLYALNNDYQIKHEAKSHLDVERKSIIDKYNAVSNAYWNQESEDDVTKRINAYNDIVNDIGEYASDLSHYYGETYNIDKELSDIRWALSGDAKALSMRTLPSIKEKKQQAAMAAEAHNSVNTDNTVASSPTTKTCLWCGKTFDVSKGWDYIAGDCYPSETHPTYCSLKCCKESESSSKVNY
jgi:hypothetical protein